MTTTFTTTLYKNIIYVSSLPFLDNKNQKWTGRVYIQLIGFFIYFIQQINEKSKFLNFGLKDPREKIFFFREEQKYLNPYLKEYKFHLKFKHNTL